MKVMQRILGRFYDVPLIRLVFEIVFVILPVAFLIRTFGFGLYQVPTGSMETTLLVGERFFADKLSYWFRPPQRGEIIAFNDPRYPYSSNPTMNFWQRYVSWNVSNWTKRVIGIPGDHVQGKLEDGKPVVYVNGVKLDESGYMNKYPLIMVWKQPGTFTEGARKREWDQKTFDPSLPWDKQVFYKINPNSIVVNPHTLEPYVAYPYTPQPAGKDVFDVHLKENEYWAMGDNRQGSSDSRDWGILDGKLIHGKIIYRIWSMDTSESWWFIDLLKNPISFWKKVRWNRCFQWVK